MASGGGGSTDTSWCSVCLYDSRNTAARYFCLECEEFFCNECVKSHKILRALKNHKLSELDDSNDDDKSTSVTGSDFIDNDQGLRCALHHGQLFDTYCKNHDVVCCGTCALLEHRTCSRIAIDTALKDFQPSSSVKISQEALTANLVLCKQEKKKRVDNMKCIDAQGHELIDDVDNFEEILIARIKELANLSREEIRSKQTEHKAALSNDVATLDAVMTTINAYLNKLDQTHDEALLFAFVKNIAKVIKDGETLLQTMTQEWKKIAIAYHLDRPFEVSVNGMKSLGELEEVSLPDMHEATSHENVDTDQESDVSVSSMNSSGLLEDESPPDEYTATFERNIDILQTGDDGTLAFDMCLMDSNNILLTDHNNKKLKRFDSDLQFKDEIVLSGRPVAVCKTGQHEAGVRILGSNVVHLVSVGDTMELTSTLTLGYGGWGVVCECETGEIFSCDSTKVCVYNNKTGNKLRTYEEDANGEKIFSGCIQIALSDNKQDIYVTDINKGLVVLDAKKCTVKMKVTVPGVSTAWPLCLLSDRVCLVGDSDTGVFVQIDTEGKSMGNIIDSKVGTAMGGPRCAVYDRERRRLIVGGYSAVVSVYTICAK